MYTAVSQVCIQLYRVDRESRRQQHNEQPTSTTDHQHADIYTDPEHPEQPAMKLTLYAAAAAATLVGAEAACDAADIEAIAKCVASSMAANV